MESKRIPGNAFHILKRCVAARQLIVSTGERLQWKGSSGIVELLPALDTAKCACAFPSTVDIHSLEKSP